MTIASATREILQKYSSIRGKNKSQFPFPYWDVVVLTASDEGQKDAYEQQIEDKLVKGELPNGIPYLVFADPVGPKVGCGGSTFHVISELFDRYKDELWTLKILLINAGGQSQRLPSASVLGKIFTPLPCGNPMYQVFDLKLASYIPFIAKMKPGIFHAAADTIEVFDLGDGDQWSFTQPGFTALAHPSPLEIGATHGVYVLEGNGPPSTLAALRSCSEVLQKPSIDRMYEKKAVLEHRDGSKFVYTDSCFFFDHVTSKKFLEFYRKHKPLRCEIDSYGDFLQALGPAATDEYTADTKNVSSIEPVLVETRKYIYNLLKGTQLNVLALEESKFYHLGTAEEYINNFCVDDVLAEEMGFQRKAFVAFTQENQACDVSKRRKIDLIEGCVMHSHLTASGTSVSKTAVLEYCDFDVPLTIEANTLINNCSFLSSTAENTGLIRESFTLPPNMFLHTVPLCKERSENVVTVAFGIFDNVKKTVSKGDVAELKWFGLPLVRVLEKLHWDIDSVFAGEEKCSLWKAKLFPVCSSYSESFLRVCDLINFCVTNSECSCYDLNNERISLYDAVVKLKDSKAILRYRNALYRRIVACE